MYSIGTESTRNGAENLVSFPFQATAEQFPHPSRLFQNKDFTMNTSLSKFCKDNGLPKSTVYRRCQELGLDTSDGLSPEACDRLRHEFDVVLEPPETEPVAVEKPAVSVEVGNHVIVLSQPELPQTYSLESLRQSEVVAFDDPLAIAAQFLQTADALTEEMQRDIRVREHKLQQTQQAKAAIAEKATEFKLEARLYRERTAMLATAQSQETQSLQQSLTTLQNLGKPPAGA